ncbi:hypothetical protein LCGC14_2447650 [marine sediment metagenome]|uniref:Uncharacterized protein n=1 Tax=marine sediment metagenome TaxID=412755 RepID=A0A0F9BH99_9ZZZZ
MEPNINKAKRPFTPFILGTLLGPDYDRNGGIAKISKEESLRFDVLRQDRKRRNKARDKSKKRNRR